MLFPARGIHPRPFVAHRIAAPSRLPTRASSSADHTAIQQRVFDAAVPNFLQPTPAEVKDRLAAIAAAVSNLSPSSRVLDIGTGTGALIPHIVATGVADILAVDLSPAMLAAFHQAWPPPPALGNQPRVRTWLGDVLTVPRYMVIMHLCLL